MKLELGAGQRPTPGYISTDLNAAEGVRAVAAQDVDLPDNSLDEVLALGVIEHLTYEQVRATFANVHRMLKPGGEFLFDVPNLAVWCQYLVEADNDGTPPFSLEHILCTLFGWQRWPGDEHKSGWLFDTLIKELIDFADVNVSTTAWQFIERGHDRRRFHRPHDAHLYVIAVK